SFNGVSLHVPKGIINSIISLSYVKKVHLDKKVQAYLHESIPLIKADSLWALYNAKGDSIVVGILDTGIDYLHPSLGGGFGKGFKVIGGYDIINDDVDPMDDHGHGTHVAGIVSANNDSIKGVAPKSLLMAFKVLDQTGFGLESHIIAGIERAVDPNNDGNYDDKVDIVNMSLGDNNGSPDDAQSVAVDNAVELGVIFCIAAGNDGNYNTIGSPGTAEKAITVGSSDKSDILSDFSSKGPNKKSFSIKPDILAPGSQILSSVIGGGYEKNSGTSMATPHVAGVCALLKQIHKDWTPEMIKSAIMTTSKDLNVDEMSQGSGRIDALKAARVTTLAIPSSLGFGIDIDSLNLWTKYDTVLVTNISTSAQTYYVNINGLILGVTLEANSNSFTLSGDETKQLIFTLKVNNAVVPYTSDSTFTYAGNVYITGESDSLHIPWAFVKKPLLILNYDKLPILQEIFNSKNNNWSSQINIGSDFKQGNILVSPGTYTMFFYYDDFASEKRDLRFVVKENVVIDGSKEITINSNEVQNQIQFNGIDENGKLLDSLQNSMIDFSIFYEGESGSFGITNLFPINCSIKSTNYKDFVIYAVEQNIETADIHKIRIINYPKKIGLEGNYTFSNSSNDYLKQKFNIKLHPNTKNYNVSLGYIEIEKYSSFIDLNPNLSFDVKDISNGELFITRDLNTNGKVIKRSFLITDFGLDTDKNLIIPQQGSWFISGYFEPKEEKIILMS
ncbi:MAG: S8 family serine peptidase, partial [Ignavibacteriae bacterium]|nr:S8 family serine peptidase [Ignavibacteriota bacterium]